MNNPNILDQDTLSEHTLSEQLKALDRTLTQATPSEAILMLEELAGELDCETLFDELNIPILTDVFETRPPQNAHLANPQ